MIIFSPARLKHQSFSKFVITYRQYASTAGDKYTLSFRVSSQQKLSGRIPFYLLPTFFDSQLSQDGLCGAFNLRGAMRNRIVSEGFVTGNFEIKWRFLNFEVLKQNFFASASLFYDNAFITQTYTIDITSITAEERQLFFRNTRQNLHHTVGTGFF